MDADPNLSLRAAAEIHSVHHTKLSRHRSRGIRYCPMYPWSGFERVSFPLVWWGGYGRSTSRRPGVGAPWAANFVKRHPELIMRFNRKYDYHRALCVAWFVAGLPLYIISLRNMVSRIRDIYNLDETGFLMGTIGTTTVVTSSERYGRAKTKQPGNREWVTIIQDINSVGWAIPPFIIVRDKYHLGSWYEDSPLPKDWVLLHPITARLLMRGAWNGSSTSTSIQNPELLAPIVFRSLMAARVTTQPVLRFTAKRII